MDKDARALMVGSESVPCEVHFSHRRRTFAIEVRPEPRIVVRAPAKCPDWLIEARLAERMRWITRQVERLRERRRARVPAPAWVTGETHFYLGRPQLLEVVEGRRARIEHREGRLRAEMPPGAGPDRVRRALDGWFREQARGVFGEILAVQFALFDSQGRYRCPELAVRRMKTRWGTLVDRRRMTLNLCLIHAPGECIEYVVVHELCHLLYRGHGPRFRALLDRKLPDWRERRSRLEALGLP